MKPYLISLGAGLLVGVVYHLLSVKSPAPPAIALIGLLGMLIGEQVIPVGRRVITGQPVRALIKKECAPDVLGPQANPKTNTPEQKA